VILDFSIIILSILLFLTNDMKSLQRGMILNDIIFSYKYKSVFSSIVTIVNRGYISIL